MWATVWKPLLLLEMVDNGKGGSVPGTAERVWRLAKRIYNTGYRHSKREREKHDSGNNQGS